jgi:hypothetical protein
VEILIIKKNTWWAEKKDAFGRFNAVRLEEARVSDGKLDHLLDLLQDVPENFVLKTI